MLNAPSREPSRDAGPPADPKSATARAPKPVAPGVRVRVTQLDVAKAAGVHSTTVSLALRNNPAIPLATRKRIQAVAEQLGYSPDPALSALVLYRRNIAPARRTETIAYVTHGKTRWGWREHPADEHIFLGAQRRAAEAGYQLEPFWLGEPGMTARRLSNVFFHRAIAGVLLAPAGPDTARPIDFDWERLSVVSIGHRPASPGLHRVAHDATSDIRLAMRQALRAGFQRIGLILPQAWDDRADLAWSMGFLAEQSRLPAAQRIPIFFHADAEPGPLFYRPQGAALDLTRLGRWLFDFQPDALLGSFPLVSSALTRLGVDLPHDCAFIELQHPGDNPALAGLQPDFHRIGEVASDLLIGQLQQNLRGLPKHPTTTLVEGVWCEGASLSRSALTPFSPSPDGPAEQPAESSIAV